MTDVAIVRVQALGAPEVDYPRAERLVVGNPRRETWTSFVGAEGEATVGIWTCQTGAWRIRFSAHKLEFFCVQQGRVRLHDAAGATQDFGPGEAAVIPAGFVGTFEVLEPVRKYFVVLERTAQ